VGITADLFGAIRRAFFLFLETCFIIILRSLVKDFLTEVKIITTQNHQSAHKFKYGTSTSHESSESQLAQKDPIFPLRKKIRRYRTNVSTYPTDFYHGNFLFILISGDP